MDQVVSFHKVKLTNSNVQTVYGKGENLPFERSLTAFFAIGNRNGQLLHLHRVKCFFLLESVQQTLYSQDAIG